MHGGALLKIVKFLTVAAVVLFAASLVRADGVDGRINVNPGPDPPANLGTCGSAQFFADANGAFNVNCDTDKLTTSISFAALDAQTNGGLSCASGLTSLFPTKGTFAFLSEFNWTETNTSANGVDTCTFTAPTMPSNMTFADINYWLTKLGIINDGDCDENDFIFGIPKNCSINFNTNADNTLLFAAGAGADAGVNGANLLPLPEPSSLGLLAIGFVALFFGRRLKIGSSEAV